MVFWANSVQIPFPGSLGCPNEGVPETLRPGGMPFLQFKSILIRA
jgi:hypothetical protein